MRVPHAPKYAHISETTPRRTVISNYLLYKRQVRGSKLHNAALHRFIRLVHVHMHTLLAEPEPAEELSGPMPQQRAWDDNDDTGTVGLRRKSRRTTNGTVPSDSSSDTDEKAICNFATEDADSGVNCALVF